ncbi:hypothetical protein [Desulfonatronum thioautotrophicum]|uniref:hypothetical protein n=1 Tax=Desulfonatronum thioautotrophicum TaxID=617001 RepID=UPI0005EAF998|nr:hypothetical protein [Desulfonatronum thioautotrophicum]
MQKETLEKVFEYASMPLHGTLSRKLRKGMKIQINEGRIYESAVLFLGTEFIRITEKDGATAVNTYYSWEGVQSIRTYSPEAE